MPTQFISDNYAVMRHAAVEEEGEKVFWQPEDLEVCQRVAVALARKMKGRIVQIFHSPQPRARATAEAVERMLVMHEVMVKGIGPLEFLDDNRLEITNENIETVVNTKIDDGTFTIFISHLHDVARYIGIRMKRDLDSVTNCSVYSARFKIPGR